MITLAVCEAEIKEYIQVRRKFITFQNFNIYFITF
jgi:hypothetical protein